MSFIPLVDTPTFSLIETPSVVQFIHKKEQLFLHYVKSDDAWILFKNHQQIARLEGMPPFLNFSDAIDDLLYPPCYSPRRQIELGALTDAHIHDMLHDYLEIEDVGSVFSLLCLGKSLEYGTHFTGIAKKNHPVVGIFGATKNLRCAKQKSTPLPTKTILGKYYERTDEQTEAWITLFTTLGIPLDQGTLVENDAQRVGATQLDANETHAPSCFSTLQIAADTSVIAKKIALEMGVPLAPRALFWLKNFRPIHKSTIAFDYVYFFAKSTHLAAADELNHLFDLCSLPQSAPALSTFVTFLVHIGLLKKDLPTLENTLLAHPHFLHSEFSKNAWYIYWNNLRNTFIKDAIDSLPQTRSTQSIKKSVSQDEHFSSAQLLELMRSLIFCMQQSQFTYQDIAQTALRSYFSLSEEYELEKTAALLNRQNPTQEMLVHTLLQRQEQLQFFIDLMPSDSLNLALLLQAPEAPKPDAQLSSVDVLFLSLLHITAHDLAPYKNFFNKTGTIYIAFKEAQERALEEQKMLEDLLLKSNDAKDEKNRQYHTADRTL